VISLIIAQPVPAVYTKAKKPNQTHPVGFVPAIAKRKNVTSVASGSNTMNNPMFITLTADRTMPTGAT
jgi:hypothetical protein